MNTPIKIEITVVTDPESYEAPHNEELATFKDNGEWLWIDYENQRLIIPKDVLKIFIN